MFYRISIHITNKICEVNPEKAIFKRKSEKETTFDVNGFEKKMTNGKLNKVHINHIKSDKNVENYQNYLFTDDIEIGTQILFEAYEEHCRKAIQAMDKFNNFKREFYGKML